MPIVVMHIRTLLYYLRVCLIVAAVANGSSSGITSSRGSKGRSRIVAVISEWSFVRNACARAWERERESVCVYVRECERERERACLRTCVSVFAPSGTTHVSTHAHMTPPPHPPPPPPACRHLSFNQFAQLITFRSADNGPYPKTRVNALQAVHLARWVHHVGIQAHIIRRFNLMKFHAIESTCIQIHSHFFEALSHKKKWQTCKLSLSPYEQATAISLWNNA